MTAVHQIIEANTWIAALIMIASFVVLAKCADIFVESAISIAYKLKLPKLVVGLVLVSFATTAPELAVSMVSALRGNAEIALGNAVGSVLCNTGLGLALCALFAASTTMLTPRVIKQSGTMLLTVSVLAFLMTAFDSTLQRWEGAVLVLTFCAYMVVLFREHRGGQSHDEDEWETIEAHTDLSIIKLVSLFVLGLVGILVASDMIVASATTIAHALHIPGGIIALTLVAFGTSVPEVATCITAARKNHAALAVGNVLGANIMNICWVAGASALVNDLTLTPREIRFMFPVMLTVIVAAHLLLRHRWRLTRRHGYALLGMYLAYLVAAFIVFQR